MDRPTCKTCHHWFDRRCRESPPAPVRGWDFDGSDQIVYKQPIVDSTDSCGRHPEFQAWVDQNKEPYRRATDGDHEDAAKNPLMHH